MNWDCSQEDRIFNLLIEENEFLKEQIKKKDETIDFLEELIVRRGKYNGDIYSNNYKV